MLITKIIPTFTGNLLIRTGFINIMKGKILTIALCLSAVMFASCEREPADSQNGLTPAESGKLLLQVGGDAVQTKGSATQPVVASFDLTEEGDEYSVVLTATVTDLDAPAYIEPETKGAPIYTENFNFSTISSVPFYWANGGTPAKPASYDKWSNVQDPSQRLYFYDSDSSKNLYLFLSVPVDMSSSTAQYGISGINQTVTGTTGKISFSYATPDDATNQKDVLFAGKYAPIGTGRAEILFYHPLAGVKFKSSNAKRESDNSSNVTTTIKSVTITDILSDGTCVMTPADIEDGKKSADCVEWTRGTTKKTVKISGLGIVNNEKYSEETGFEGTSGQNLGQYNINDTEFEHTFMLMPQKTAAGVKLTIVYTLSNNPGKEYTRTLSFKDQDWVAGKLYTYTLETNHVAVSVTDQVSGSTKSNLAITNTGNVDAYIRAIIIGNWFDTHDLSQIVYPWTDSDKDGAFTGFNTTDWVDGGDGYYYYKYIVRPGEETNDLFTSYTAAATCPMALYANSAHLELEVLAQAFDAAKLSTMGFGWQTGKFADTYVDGTKPASASK